MWQSSDHSRSCPDRKWQTRRGRGSKKPRVPLEDHPGKNHSAVSFQTASCVPPRRPREVRVRRKPVKTEVAETINVRGGRSVPDGGTGSARRCGAFTGIRRAGRRPAALIHGEQSSITKLQRLKPDPYRHQTES